MLSSHSTIIYVYRGGGYNCDFLDRRWKGEGDAPPKDVTNVTFHPNVTSIGSRAFEDCVSLVSIGIPPTVTTIRCFAFQGCCSFTNVTLPSSLTSIDPYAFAVCTSLVSIRLPLPLTDIDGRAFKGCNSLRSVLGPTSSNGRYHNFHSLLATICFCYINFMEQLIKLHPEQLKEVDQNGNLPLHITASSSAFSKRTKEEIIKAVLHAHPDGAKVRNNDGNLPLHIRSSSKGKHVEDIERLLAAYPEAVQLRNNNGKLPLCIALESKKEWCDGVETLLNAFPAVTIEVDGESNMFPFMTAASEESGSCLDSIYSLLRTRPEMNAFYCARQHTRGCSGRQSQELR